MKPQRSPASPRAREVRAIDAIARDLPSTPGEAMLGRLDPHHPGVARREGAARAVHSVRGARGPARPGLAATAPR